MERIEEALEEMNIKYEFEERLPYPGKDSWYGLVEFWTDTAGQDIPTEIEFDGTAEDFVRQFVERADNYNVDDEVELYVNMRGKNGVPNTVRELLDDCQEAKDTLMEIAEKLKDALKDGGN